MQTSKHSNDLLASLSKYDTPTICNAVELFDIRPRTEGYMNGSIHSCFPHMPPMVGYAVTAKFRASDSPDENDIYQSVLQQAEYVNSLGMAAVVVFEDLDNPPVAATFGEVLCSIYQACGATGLISSGAGRDLDQVEAISFPTFVGSTICAHGYCNIVETDAAVQVGGLAIKPGTLLHGDRNGVTTIPHEIASEIPQVCAKYMKVEKIVLDYLKEKSFTTAGLAEAMKECKNQLGALKTSLRGRVN